VGHDCWGRRVGLAVYCVVENGLWNVVVRRVLRTIAVGMGHVLESNKDAM